VALSPKEQADLRNGAREAMIHSTFIASLGIVAERWEEGGVRLRLPFEPRLTNDGAVHHGGVVATLMDTAGASSVWAGHDFEKGTRAATVSMTVNFTGAARGSDLIADAVCVKRGRELAFAEIRVTDPAGKSVATGTLVYRIVP
jgi:uncharacterized protein (TIGR00369 family)